MPTALALSPHLDDAVFSCGGTLAALRDTGWRVVIATVFTQSVPNPTGFALACQFDKGLGREVDYMALRRAEDARAAAILGAEAVWLPFPEAPHRGYGSAAALFGPVADHDRIGDALEGALGRLLDDHEPSLILAPQAVGAHVDHVTMVRSVRRIGPPGAVLWWRDFPYSIRPGTPPEPFREDWEVLPEIVARPGTEALSRRCAATLAYESQIGFQFGGAEGVRSTIARHGTRETFRSTDPACAGWLQQAGL